LNPPVEPGDTLDSSVHVFPLTSHGTAKVQVQVGTFSDPATRYIYDFTAESIVTSVEETNSAVNDYVLEQNYPNPFNPSTKISYRVKEGGFVSIKVYNILGSEVASLVNEYQPAGNYNVDFKGSELSSGIYLYKYTVNNFTQTRKMILEK
ncbi:MAG: T9SS type A sorting domain-containing protein, partial [Nitrososphaeraceae archaeon]|nr:T9SS type A sorting domain-containing protein [Nitrososphaeraceae archaeon]